MPGSHGRRWGLRVWATHGHGRASSRQEGHGGQAQEACRVCLVQREGVHRREQERHGHQAIVRHMQRYGHGLMTDRITCPECGGEGEHKLGPLSFLCCLCHGTGEVGGDNEPAERDDRTEFNPYTDESPVWESERRNVPFCLMCLGAGEVVNVGDIREPSKVIRSPCPSCCPTASS